MMERLRYSPKPRIEPMYDVKGDADGLKVYGEHKEIEKIIRYQVQFAQEPLSQRRIEVIPKPTGASYIYSNNKINQPEYKTKEGSQHLIDELLQFVSPSSTIIFDNRDISPNSANALLWAHPSLIRLRASLAGDSNLSMSPDDVDAFDRLFSNVQLNPDRWAEE